MLRQTLDDRAAIYVWIADLSPESAPQCSMRFSMRRERLGCMPRSVQARSAKDTLKYTAGAHSYVIVDELDRANDRLTLIDVFSGAQEIRLP